MSPKQVFWLTALLFFVFCSKNDIKQHTKGYLFIIGGGERSDSMMKRFIVLADGFNSGKIIVLPMASDDPLDTGNYHTNQLKELGATKVSCLNISGEAAHQDSSVKKLNGATGIFFSGGDQSRLMEAIGGTPFAEKIHQLYQQGAVIGGTSAGAAVMSEIMITGDEIRPEKESDRAFNRIEGANIVTRKGFGFLTNVIIDQHFVRRKRLNRLISLIIEHPTLVGIGIDEATAVLVYPNQTFEVLGENGIVVFDARQAKAAPFDSTQSFNLAATNIKMHVLTRGFKINLLTNKIDYPIYEEKKDLH